MNQQRHMQIVSSDWGRIGTETESRRPARSAARGKGEPKRRMLTHERALFETEFRFRFPLRSTSPPFGRRKVVTDPSQLERVRLQSIGKPISRLTNENERKIEGTKCPQFDKKNFLILFCQLSSSPRDRTMKMNFAKKTRKKKIIFIARSNSGDSIVCRHKSAFLCSTSRAGE